MKLFLLILVLLVIASVGYLQLDDELNLEATKYINLMEERKYSGSNSYLYLVGMGAPEGRDPFLQGKELLLLFKAISDSSDAKTVETINDQIDAIDELDIPDRSDPIYCKIREQACLDSILDSSDRWQGEVTSRGIHLERYEKFIQFEEFVTLTTPSLSEWFPKSSFLFIGNRIKLLVAMMLAENGNSQQALRSLLDDLPRLRRHLELADNLIQKMVMISLISDNLDILIYLSDRYGGHDSFNIPQLTKAEHNMEKPFVREFIASHHVLLDLDRNPNFFRTHNADERFGSPGWVVRSVYKPKMTTNVIVSSYEEPIRLSKLSQVEFAKAISKHSVADVMGLHKTNGFSFRNYWGSRLASIGGPYLSEWVSRVFDLNCKIAITNYFLRGNKTILENPYGDSKFPIEEHKGSICMSGPIQDSRRLRCTNLPVGRKIVE